MNLQSFEYFIALARERNFTHAAKSLHITQQSLSSHIAALEKELGCQLVVRRTPLLLTYAGEAFLRHAENMCRLKHSIYQEFCDISQNQKGELRVGIAYTRGRAIMPKLIAAFQRKYPHVEVNMTGGTNKELQELLVNGSLDLAIANFSKDLPEIDLKDFMTERIMLLIPDALLEKCSVSLETEREKLESGNLTALRDCPFLLGNDADIAGRMGCDFLDSSGFRPVVKARSDNIEVLLDLCVQGIGICFSPENLVYAILSEQQRKQIHILPLTNHGSYLISFGYARRSYQWSIISEFIRIAREEFVV